MEQPAPYHSREGHQAGGLAWSPSRPDIVTLLERGRHVRYESIYYGSNHCFLVTLECEGLGTSLAVYKPARGEYPLYDFPAGSLYRREVGSWLVNHLLGWEMLPPTVVTQGKYGAGSLQLFIESYSEGEIRVSELQKLALLDLVLNNADRKSDHLLLGESGKVWGIDHGLTFHAQPKLRTVLWHFAGEEVPVDELQDLKDLSRELRRPSRPEAKALQGLISRGEWQALELRVERLAQSGVFPNPRYKPVPYRW